MNSFQNPDKNCQLCPRLVEYRNQNKEKFPDKFNAPVPAFGALDAELFILGLAPGLKGANFSGRPFTGDYAGDLLYKTLAETGFARGKYDARPDDGLELLNVRISNAVRCVPPENKPTTEEMKTCLPFLLSEFSAMPNLKVILSLGKISHDSVMRNFGYKLSQHKFGHAAVHELENGYILVDSYHCSRYNTQTGRLTEKMFSDVFELIKKHLKKARKSAA